MSQPRPIAATRDTILEERVYIILGGLFIAFLVACNLMFQKFFVWEPFGLYRFELSVGILPYPFTFLVTDLISEIYGRRRANQVVVAGLVASFFVMGFVTISQWAPATAWSPVDNEMFATVFGLTGAAVFASMAAYLTAQFIDIRIFHFWKRLTKGKHLWLRNNGSTVVSQIVDTAVVIGLLCYFNVLQWEQFWGLFVNGFLFKVLVAFFDTPFFYLGTYGLRALFNLEEGEELHGHDLSPERTTP